LYLGISYLTRGSWDSLISQKPLASVHVLEALTLKLPYIPSSLISPYLRTQITTCHMQGTPMSKVERFPKGKIGAKIPAVEIRVGVSTGTRSETPATGVFNLASHRYPVTTTTKL
jgi:hypothetical protein